MRSLGLPLDKDGQWKLLPAYDLTFSSGPHGEQSTMVMGEGRNLNTNHLLKLANEAKIKKDRTEEIVEFTKSSLSKWPALAKKYGVSDANIKLIKQKLSEQLK